MRIATRISFAVTVPVLIVCARAWSASQPPEIPASAARSVLSQPRRDAAPEHGPALMQDDPFDESVVDLYGNEVSDAVARYKVDPEGSLYELHSPHTELPRLGSPKS